MLLCLCTKQPCVAHVQGRCLVCSPQALVFHAKEVLEGPALGEMEAASSADPMIREGKALIHLMRIVACPALRCSCAHPLCCSMCRTLMATPIEAATCFSRLRMYQMAVLHRTSALSRLPQICVLLGPCLTKSLWDCCDLRTFHCHLAAFSLSDDRCALRAANSTILCQHTHGRHGCHMLSSGPEGPVHLYLALCSHITSLVKLPCCKTSPSRFSRS